MVAKAGPVVGGGLYLFKTKVVKVGLNADGKETEYRREFFQNALRFIHLFSRIPSRRLLVLGFFFFVSISRWRNNMKPRKVK